MQRLGFATLLASFCNLNLLIENVEKRRLAGIATADDQHLFTVRVLIIKLEFVVFDSFDEVADIAIVQPIDLLHALILLTLVKEHLRALSDVALGNLKALLFLGVFKLSRKPCVHFAELVDFVHLSLNLIQLMHFIERDGWSWLHYPFKLSELTDIYVIYLHIKAHKLGLTKQQRLA